MHIYMHANIYIRTYRIYTFKHVYICIVFDQKHIRDVHMYHNTSVWTSVHIGLIYIYFYRDGTRLDISTSTITK